MGNGDLSTEASFDKGAGGDKICSASVSIIVFLSILTILYIDVISYAVPYLSKRYKGYELEKC